VLSLYKIVKQNYWDIEEENKNFWYGGLTVKDIQFMLANSLFLKNISVRLTCFKSIY
jgi:hypothetical protein